MASPCAAVEDQDLVSWPRWPGSCMLAAAAPSANGLSRQARRHNHGRYLGVYYELWNLMESSSDEGIAGNSISQRELGSRVLVETRLG